MEQYKNYRSERPTMEQRKSILFDSYRCEGFRLNHQWIHMLVAVWTDLANPKKEYPEHIQKRALELILEHTASSEAFFLSGSSPISGMALAVTYDGFLEYLIDRGFLPGVINGMVSSSQRVALNLNLTSGLRNSCYVIRNRRLS